MYDILGSKKQLTSSFHPQTNGCVERLNHTVCQMLSHVVSSKQDDWDEYLLQVVYAHNNHISKATGLAPNEVHIGRYPEVVDGGKTQSTDQEQTKEEMKTQQFSSYYLVFSRWMA